jgi:hypothetical protein
LHGAVRFLGGDRRHQTQEAINGPVGIVGKPSGQSRILRRLNGAMQTLNWRGTLGGARQAPPRSQLPQERRRLLPQYAPGAEEPEQHGQQ